MGNIDFKAIITEESVQRTAHGRLMQSLSETRWRYENAGVKVAQNIRVQSDRSSRAELTGLLHSLDAEEMVQAVEWKALSGWFTLTPDLIEKALSLANAHVRACFIAERVVSEQISSGGLLDELEIDTSFKNALRIAKKE